MKKAHYQKRFVWALILAIAAYGLPVHPSAAAMEITGGGTGGIPTTDPFEEPDPGLPEGSCGACLFLTSHFLESNPLSAANLPAVKQQNFSFDTIDENPSVSTRTLPEAADPPAYININPIDRDNFSYRYDIGSGAGVSAEVIIENPDMPMMLGSTFTMAFQRINDNAGDDGIEEIHVTFVDDQNNSVTYDVSGLTDQLESYEFQLNGQGLDFNNIQRIILSQGYEDLTPGERHLERRGEIFVAVGGLKTPLPVDGTAYDEELLSPLPVDVSVSAQGVVNGPGSLPAFVHLIEETEEALPEGTHAFRYDVGTSVGATAEVTVMHNPPMVFEQPHMIAMKNSGNNAMASIHLTDTSGRHAEYVLNLTDQFRNFSLDTGDAFYIEDGFDRTQVDKMVVRVDRGLSPERRGRIDFQYGIDNNQIPIITGLPILQGDEPSVITNELEAAFSGDFISPVDNGEPLAYNFNVQASAQAVTTAEITSKQGTMSVPEDLIVFMKAENIGSALDLPVLVRLEIKDAANNKKTVDIALTDELQKFTIPLNGAGVTAQNGGLDPSQITSIKLMQSQSIVGLNRRARVSMRYTPDPFLSNAPVIQDITKQDNGNVVIDFSPVPDAVVYQVQVATDSNFTNIIHEGFPGVSPESLGVADAGTYHVRIRASKNNFIEVGPLSEWSQVSTFEGMDFADLKPVGVSILFLDNGQEELHFSTVADAQIYHVQIATDPDFNNIVHEGHPPGNVETFDVPGGLRYYARVRASRHPLVVIGPLSMFSETFSFIDLGEPLVIEPSGNMTPDDLPGLPTGEAGALKPTSLGSGGDSVDSSQATPRGIQTDFDTGTQGSSGGFAGGGLSFDDFGTNPFESGDLSGLTELKFGIKADVTDLKFEIIDIFDNKHSVQLTGIQANAEQIYVIPTSALTGIDLTKVRLMYFIAEGHGKSGSMMINYLPPTISIGPSGSLTTADLPGLPTGEAGALKPTSLGSGGDSSDSSAATPRGVTADYNTGTQGSSGGFAGGGLSFDDFGTNPFESGDLSGLSELRFGVKADIAQLKFEIIDIFNNKQSVQLTGIKSDEEQVYVIPTATLAGVDLTKARIMYFIVEGHGHAGSMMINYLPSDPEIAPSANLRPDDLGGFPEGDVGAFFATSLGSGGDATDVSEATLRGVKVTFNTGTEGGGSGGFAGAGLTYDDFGTNPLIEKGDVSQMQVFRFGVKADVDRLKLEFIDADGNKDHVFLTGVKSDQEQIYEIPVSAFEGVDLTKARIFYFIAEGHGKQGMIEVNYRPALTPHPTLTPADIPDQDIDFGTEPIGLSFATPDSSAAISPVPRGLKLDFTTGPSEFDFAGGGLTFDDPDTGNVVETGDITALNSYVMGIIGDVEQVTLEVTDENNNVFQIPLLGIMSGTEQIYVLPFDLISNVDLTKVKNFIFVVVGANLSGSLEVRDEPLV